MKQNWKESHLLIVDDNEQIREMLRRRCQREGYVITSTQNGYDALENIEKTNFDTVLLDIMMPEINGIDTLKKIREKYSQAQLPVIMISAKQQSEDIVEAINLGANDYITKPIDFPVALARIETQILRKKSEEALLETQNRLKQFIEAIPIGVLIIDQDGHPYYANKTSKEIFGKDIMNGEKADQFAGFHEAYLAGTDEKYPTEKMPFVRALLGESTRIDDVEILRPDKKILLEAWGTPIYDAGGQIRYALAAFLDITERKEIEKMKNDFISIVSHELRTPLTSIKGSLELTTLQLSNKELKETNIQKIKDLTEIAFRNTERLVRLINDILDIEKIESGKMVLDMKSYEIEYLIQKSIQENKHYGDKFNVEFKLIGSIKNVIINVDHDRFLQVMANLLSNAAKFSHSGSEVKIDVKVHNEKYIRISVTDRGAGIPQEFRDKIFDKFIQVDSSDSRKKVGTGLGLSISKAIIESMGGKIDLESEINVGTTFFFDLPRI